MRSTGQSSVLGVLVGTLVLVGCGGGDDLVTATPGPVATTDDDPTEDQTDAGRTGKPTDPATPVASPTEESPGDPVDDGDSGDEDALDAGVDAAAALAALEEAQVRWADNDGLLYVWGYREEGEGLVDEFCVEGVVGATASDAAACPFEATPGGRSVEAWFDTIEFVLVEMVATGRTADVVYDPTNGHPLEIAISGGEVDSLLVTSLLFELVDGGDVASDEDLGVLASACAAGDAVACYDLGAAGEPLPPALATGNELTQAPDLDVLDRCGAGEAAACHEAGARGLGLG